MAQSQMAPLTAGSLSSPEHVHAQAFSQRGNWLPRKGSKQCRSPEITKYHFYHISLVKGSCRTHIDSREGGIHSTFRWSGWPKIQGYLLFPVAIKTIIPKLAKGATTAEETPYHLIQGTQCLTLMVLTSAVKLPSPTAANTTIDFIHSPQWQPPQASGLSQGSGLGSGVLSSTASDLRD